MATTGKLDLNSLRANKAGMLDTGTLKGYLCTPKYWPAHDDNRRMARLYIPNSLFTVITNLYPQARSDKTLRSLTSNEPNSQAAGFFNFLLQSVQEAHSENVQVVQTLADNFVTFSMGSRPPVFAYGGTLINSQEDDWRTQFLTLYSSYLRASKMAKFGGRSNNKPIKNYTFIKYDNVYVRGVMLSLNMSMAAENELAVPFSFQYLVHDIILFKQVKDAGKDDIIVDQAGDYKTVGDLLTYVNTDDVQKTSPDKSPLLNAVALKEQKEKASGV